MDGTRTEVATEQALVHPLGGIDRDMLALVGGKAANLGELLGAGLPVPDGFCVTTDGYARLATAAGLGEVVEALDATPPEDADALAALAGKARRLLHQADVPADVAAAVESAYRELGADVPVAVRSSATAEDLPDASFAGQQDTYLGVVGTDAVVAAVRDCCASLWTDRAVTYRAANGVGQSGVRLAVVVQRMVDAAAAGVLFTADPVTGRRRTAVIDASPGLGEAVVSGLVNPDHFVVDTASGEITERRLGDEAVAIRPRAGGGTERVTSAAGDEQCVSDEQLRALAALGDRVERHYGAPQDTEWAIDADGRLWLTQARPITTLFPLPDRPADPGDLRVYFCASVAQGLYRPFTPMGRACFRLVASGMADLFGARPALDRLDGPPVYAEIGQRLFVDATLAIRSSVGRALIPRVLDVMEARSADVFRTLFDEPRLSVTLRSRRPFARRALRMGVRMRVPQRAVEVLRSPAAARRRLDAQLERVEQLVRLPADATAIDRLDFVERFLGTRFPPLLPSMMPTALAGILLAGLAGRLAGDAGLDELHEVMRGLPHNVTTEMDLRLWALATRIAADADAARVVRTLAPAELARRYHAGTLPTVAQHGLAEFLDRYGHRAVAEIDIGMPRWSDDPTHILGVLANYLDLDDPALAPDRQLRRAAEAAEVAVDSVVAKVRRQRGRIRARAVRFTLRRARELAGLRETPKYVIMVAFGGVRRHLQAVGAELATAGRIAAADDVFFLDLREARTAVHGADQHDVVAARRAAYDRELRRRHVPRVLLSDGTEPEAVGRAVAGDGALTGTPASAGTVTGVARVVLDPVGARLAPGEILVAPSTDPGWTPLFLTAGGLVMEMGGANSHGAVVAREYGIPAVVGVPGATQVIADGSRITVDGAAGTVVPAGHEVTA